MADREILEVPEPAGRLLRPGEAAGLLGVDPSSLINYHRAGLLAAERTPGGHRRYREAAVRALARTRAEAAA